MAMHSTKSAGRTVTDDLESLAVNCASNFHHFILLCYPAPAPARSFNSQLRGGESPGNTNKLFGKHLKARPVTKFKGHTRRCSVLKSVHSKPADRAAQQETPACSTLHRVASMGKQRPVVCEPAAPFCFHICPLSAHSHPLRLAAPALFIHQCMFPSSCG
jgi:hypothetical protein